MFEESRQTRPGSREGDDDEHETDDEIGQGDLEMEKSKCVVTGRSWAGSWSMRDLLQGILLCGEEGRDGVGYFLHAYLRDKDTITDGKTGNEIVAGCLELQERRGDRTDTRVSA